MFDSRPTVAWPPTTVAWPFSDFFQNFRKSLETSRKRCLTVGRRSPDLRLLSRDRSVTFFKNFPNCLKRPKNVVWLSADGRVTPTTVAWPFSDFFQNFPKSLETSKNVVWQSADGRVTSDHCRVTVLATFFKKNSNCLLKRRKIVVWQSADSRVTSDHCRVTVQRLFSKFLQIARNVQKTLFDSRPTVAWPPTTVAWQFSDFFSKNFLIAWNVQKLYLTVARWSRDHRLLSPDRSATFFKIFPNCFKTSKNVVWQSVDVRVTSVHCRVTPVTFFRVCFVRLLHTLAYVVFLVVDTFVINFYRQYQQWKMFSPIILVKERLDSALFSVHNFGISAFISCHRWKWWNRDSATTEWIGGGGCWGFTTVPVTKTIRLSGHSREILQYQSSLKDGDLQHSSALAQSPKEI